MASRESLRSKIGSPPVDDSLGAISWMQRALAQMADEVLESSLSATKKREEMLKIADRMAKLRDPDRIYQAEQALRGNRKKTDDNDPGPSLTNATPLDSAPHPVTARRGQPRRGAIR